MAFQPEDAPLKGHHILVYLRPLKPKPAIKRKIKGKN